MIMEGGCVTKQQWQTEKYTIGVRRVKGFSTFMNLLFVLRLSFGRGFNRYFLGGRPRVFCLSGMTHDSRKRGLHKNLTLSIKLKFHTWLSKMYQNSMWKKAWRIIRSGFSGGFWDYSFCLGYYSISTNFLQPWEASSFFLYSKFGSSCTIGLQIHFGLE